MDIKNTVGGATDGVTNKVQDMVKDAFEDKVNDVTAGIIDKVENMADTVGMGDMLNSVVEKVEDAVGLDLDGDGEGKSV